MSDKGTVHMRRHFFHTETLAKPIFIVALYGLLAACSEDVPDGYVYQMNGAGMTLPAAGAEVAFLPGASRAEFFFGPLSEAYLYATADLGAELVPVCNEAQALLTDQQDKNIAAQSDLKNGGSLPTNSNACLNMCTERATLEKQRGQAKQELAATIAELGSEIAIAVDQIGKLRASRSEKAGALGQQLDDLQAARRKSLNEAANKLLQNQLSKISFSIDSTTRYSMDRGKQVRVTLINGSDYAITKSSFRDVTFEGYYRGVLINEHAVSIPAYGERETLKDTYGFDLGYLVPPGGRVVTGDGSIDYFPGLNTNSAEGRLLMSERGWSPNSKGYILPDNIRIKKFSANLFVIPDESGTRSGSTITYSPRPVNFVAEAAAKGLPEDAEIARLKSKIDGQSYPEDQQIRDLLALIDDLQEEQKTANERYTNSEIAKQISQLLTDENSCRNARDRYAKLENESQELASIETNLASCGSATVDSTAIFRAVAALNRLTGVEIQTPDISERYSIKAGELVFRKLAEHTQVTTLTSIDGGYSIPSGVDTDSHLVLVDSQFSLGDAFWLQPLSSLGDRKDLAPNTAQSGDFDDYIETIIIAGMGSSSPDQLSSRLAIWGAGARSPFSLSSTFLAAANNLFASLEKQAAPSDDTAVLNPEVNAPSACPL